MATLQCTSCGAAVELDDVSLSTQCAFCDAALVATNLVAEPVDLVVSFKIDRQVAGRRISAWLASSWLAPEALRKATRPEALDAVLVPFYVFDARAESSYQVSIGIYWYRTETYTVTVNGRTQTRTRQVRETEWHPLSGTHGTRWFDHLVSASKGLPEAESNALEPFDLGAALPFAPALLAGVAAEIATVPHDEAQQTAHAELSQLEARAIAARMLPGDTHSGLRTQSQFDIEQVRLALLPVWTAVYPGPKGPVRVLVNGQTGKVAGTIPKSWWKIGALVGLVVALLTLGFFIVTGCGGLLALVGAVE